MRQRKKLKLWQRVGFWRGPGRFLVAPLRRSHICGLTCGCCKLGGCQSHNNESFMSPKDISLLRRHLRKNIL